MNLKISMFYVSLGLVFLNLVCFSLFNPLHVKADTTSTSETWISTDLDVEDSFISSEYPSTNYSSSQYLVNGKHQTFGTTRSFLKFKLPTLPQGAVITSAKLSLYQYYNTINQAMVDIRPVTSSWNASTITWNNKPSVGSSVSNVTVQKPSWYEFYMTNQVKSWYNGTTNNGIAIQFRDETQATKIFYSNDYVSPDLKPKLTITYSVPSEPKKEYRALWVDMFHDGAKTPDQVDQLIKDAQKGNINTIFLQVRRRGDAFYTKSLEPKTEDTALQSGYDPLADLIQKAHSANPKIQVHAWFAMMPIWNKSTPPTDSNHIFNAHGMNQPSEENWLSKTYTGNYANGSEYVIDPGHPAAVNFTRDVVMNVVQNYDIDGVQMDLVRYMGEDWGYNDVSVERFNKAYGKSGLPQPADPLWKQWRRDQVSNMVRKVYTSIQSIKPAVTVSAATIAWGDGPKTMDDWNNSSTMNGALQDWRSWLEEGAIDLAVPMNYFREYDETQKTYYENWLEWEKNNQGKRMTLSGVGNYLNSIQDSMTQIQKTSLPSVSGNTLGGTSLYSYAVTNKDNVANNEFYNSLSTISNYSSNPPFSNYISPPDLSWKVSPTEGHLYGTLPNSDHQLIQVNGTEKYQVYTDGSGEFEITNLSPGTYSIEVNSKVYTVAIKAGEVSKILLD
ncbi:family 10 glycosylhydrolase [Priestia aryabhattai]|uniref:family 10 glycosylhydrolase n=1 Tax=Priestia aryabhattai TaxID=412384 RepID=UPI003CE8BAA1